MKSGVRLWAKKHYRQGALLRVQPFIMSGKTQRPLSDALDLRPCAQTKLYRLGAYQAPAEDY